MAKSKKEINPAFTPCRLVWEEWNNNFTYPALYDGSDGKALNYLIKYLSKVFQIKKGYLPDTQEIIDSWKFILSQHDNWGYEKDKRKRIREIYSKIQNILDAIKNNNATGKNQQLAASAYEAYKQQRYK
jgi:DNA phosphorothioation-dependent restriction protein DptG